MRERERATEREKERKRSEMRRGWEEEKENGVMLRVCTRLCVRGGVGRGGEGRGGQAQSVLITATVGGG